MAIDVRSIVPPTSTYLQSQEQLQEKYFATCERCYAMLSVFCETLKRSDPTTTMIVATGGATANTFLCTMTSSAIPGEELTLPVGLVFKWQRPALCSVEVVGARFFRGFGFPAPLPYQLNRELTDALQPFAEASKRDFQTTATKITAIVMPRLYANTFGDAITNGRLHRLAETDKIRLMRVFGEIAALDVILGNSDRFVFFKPSKVQPLNANRIMNTGNVMIQFNERPNMPCTLRHVYPIDNISPQALLEKNYVPLRLLRAGRSPDEEAALQITQHHDACMALLQDTGALAQHMQQNMIMSLDAQRCDSDSYRVLYAAESLFREGMEAMIARIRAVDLSSIQHALRAVGSPLDISGERVFRLITCNIETLQTRSSSNGRPAS